ncbi:hypothetical protein NQ315_003659 [Exocentrus adspersus]|uniref:DDE Tnp4 domain-containing protein n=1 Tax=Exocentrus adspersus TaxID=1586481 RepID=A0AAV8V9S3_9CUCU|nr:hypothetical protein NQ315_003659 [Exocentrus adspersus]
MDTLYIACRIYLTAPLKCVYPRIVNTNFHLRKCERANCKYEHCSEWERRATRRDSVAWSVATVYKMAPTRAVRLFLLLDTPYHTYKRLNKKIGIHPINRERHLFGEFHHLYNKLRMYPDRFWNYMRMSVRSFDYLLEKVGPHLEKIATNFVQNSYISPAERLVITIRKIMNIIYQGTEDLHLVRELLEIMVNSEVSSKKNSCGGTSWTNVWDSICNFLFSNSRNRSSLVSHSRFLLVLVSVLVVLDEDADGGLVIVCGSDNSEIFVGAGDSSTFIIYRFLVTGTTYKHLGHEFRIGYSTVSEIVKETCVIIWETLQEDYMPFPNQQQWQQIIEEYTTLWNFPNCFGAIDGKHCQIKCPPNSGTTHFNYLKYYSLGLQAVADANKKFITIEVGSKGSESDGGVFQSSTLYNLLETNRLNVPPDQALPNSNIVLPNVMIGDEAYPLKTYLMRPYPRPRNGVLDEGKQLFNDRLSRARKCIENAFGILYQKFRIFDTSILLKQSTAINVIKCACILHNFIRHFDGDSDLDYINNMEHRLNNENINARTVRNNRASNKAIDIRNSFKQYFLDGNL